MPMSTNSIEIPAKEKITTVRLTEKTKKMLDALAKGKETHEQIILRLIKLANQLQSPAGTEIHQRGRVTGTTYERLNRIFTAKCGGSTYSVVCTFNDLAVLHLLRQSASIRKYIAYDRESPQWEIDLRIENLRKEGGKWRPPDVFEQKEPREFLLLYLACLKQVLQDSFDIILYELSTEEDILSLGRWDGAYKRNELSRESFYSDIQRKLKGIA